MGKRWTPERQRRGEISSPGPQLAVESNTAVRGLAICPWNTIKSPSDGSVLVPVSSQSLFTPFFQVNVRSEQLNSRANGSGERKEKHNHSRCDADSRSRQHGSERAIIAPAGSEGRPNQKNTWVSGLSDRALSVSTEKPQSSPVIPANKCTRMLFL